MLLKSCKTCAYYLKVLLDYYLVGPQLRLNFRTELQTQAENLFAKGEAKIKTNCEKPMGGEYQDKNFKFSVGQLNQR